MTRTIVLAALFAIGTAMFACDADVLRFKPEKSTTVKPATKAASTLPANTGTRRTTIPPAASVTASTKLEPR
ncbi:MAG: hypothetical protein IPP33_13135 [Flavobacteriales bacterium]|nr:hypothetical protein [Flavobacteriales bacterium]